ncbi:glycosyltransferase family 87 protein [Gimesia algae]|uniref:Polyprenol-phosphate-mannose-dependent alpha-(1-2)-phosphatidylinositol mannoside mannosyltransferase n=1 Tax=Gimesia algae TaxID=2527971 RepID=A0A517VCB2_9PLAN|nr:glycosyltransferase family 87 protein [Gimesia algae]QDT90633.1 Polyprenol-phosphate-mannose-dependent alpha-(1-2)-phosphatidylinositol mannoside mannosyltransferase [Gimesia algae]
MTVSFEQQNYWPMARKILWVILFLLALTVFAPGYLAALRPADGQVFDFFKEWAAVQNRLSGMPVYADQEVSLLKHLNLKLTNSDGFFDRYNTHPPSANLIAVPFAWLTYQDAQLAWSLSSLGMLFLAIFWIVQALKIRMTFWSFLALLTVLLACDPLQQSLIQGQPNLLLALLIVAAWKTGRSGNSLMAGACLGLATAVKIYPAYLFLYFLIRRDVHALAGGALAFGSITLLTIAIFGSASYHDYLTVVLPSLADITNNWGNASLLAFWERLFDRPTDTISPVVDSPLLLRGTVWTSWLALTALVAGVIWKTRHAKFSDQSFAITIVAMLLMTPTTWHHYFIILLVPIGILVEEYPPYSGKRWLVNLTLLALIISPRLTWALLIPAQKTITSATASAPWQQGGMVAIPWQSLTALSYQCFALLFMITLLWPNEFPARQSAQDSTTTGVAS